VIFVLVVLWTCFPAAFAAVASTLWLPVTLIAFGVIARGSAVAFRKAVTETWQRRLQCELTLGHRGGEQRAGA